jgi:hypothetical protein
MVVQHKPQHRYHYTDDVKAVEQGKHGRDMARKRYGAVEFENGAPQPEDHSRVQSREFAQGKAYANDVPADDWKRAPGEDATLKENFDRGNAWRTQGGGRKK